jgi:hypothetical protein
MIARHWRGWTNLQDADAYEALLKSEVLPELQNIDGYKGGYILRSDGPGESEFVIVNLFANMEAVRQFAGQTIQCRSLNQKRSACLRDSIPRRSITKFVRIPRIDQ